MTDSNDEYTKQRDLAAERHSFDKGVAHGNRTEPAWHYSQVDFKAGADWAEQRMRQQLEAEREDALKYKALYTHWHNEFELKKDELTAANALIEKLGAALENLTRQTYGQSHAWAGAWTKCECGRYWAFGANWNECQPTDLCPMCVATKALAQLEQWRKERA